MLNTTYQRKNNDNTFIDINTDAQTKMTSSCSFSDYAKAGLAIVGTLAGTTMLVNKAGYLSSLSPGSNEATPGNTLDNPHQLINAKDTISLVDYHLPIQPKHAKRALGGEFQINTYTTYWQNYPSVAVLSSGDFVVAWQSFGQDGDRDGIYGQRFSSTGVPQGSEFQINTYITWLQRNPSVAALNSGDFVVTWDSTGQDGSGSSIYGQLYSSMGVPQGSEFQINTFTIDTQDNPSVATLTSGDFVVAWQSWDGEGSGSGIYIQRFSSIGVPQGADFRISTGWRNPSVAALTSGEFVVVWTRWDDGDSYGIDGQRLSISGKNVVLQGSEFQINTYTTNMQEYSVVETLGTGDFVVVWQSNGQDGSGYGIYGQRYSSTGSPQGSEFQVNTYTTGNQRDPSIVTLTTGGFVVVWASDGQDGSGYGIYGQRYSSTGSPQGSEFPISIYATGSQDVPSGAALSTDEFVVLWASDWQDGDSWGIYGRIFLNNDMPPALTSNALTINEGSAVILSPVNLRAYDPNGNGLNLTFTIYNAQYGQFERASNGGIAITNFTQQEINDANIQFVHDGSENAPTYDVSVSDGVFTDGPANASIIFNSVSDAPILVNNGLVVNEGEAVILNTTNLSVFDIDNNASELTFIISNLQYGQFERISNAGVAITSFTQQDIIDGAIRFVHDGSESTPTYDVSVSDATTIVGPANAIITFTKVNDVPVLVNNPFIINKGEAVILSPLDLSATDSDNNEPDLIFTVSNVQYGQFERISNVSIATNFTQKDIIDGNIQFVHDGSESLPEYSIDVTDGDLTSTSTIATIVFIAQNQLVTKPGDTIILGSKQLAIQSQLVPTELEISLSNIQYGRFEKNINPGVAISSFMLSELETGAIRFIHSGSENIPQFTLHFKSETANYIFPRVIVGNTILNHAPFVISPTGTLNWPINTFSNYTIPSTTFSDPDGDPLQLSVLELNDAPLPGWVQFDDATNTLTGTPAASGLHDFKIIATDPYNESVDDRFSINVKSAGNTPSLTANALSILESQTVVLTPADLAADDPDDDNNNLVFTVSNVQNGQFEKVSNLGVSITAFTQLEVINGDIQFVHDGNEAAPYYDVSVSDGTTASTNDAAAITFIKVNDAPVLSNYNILITSPGQSITLNGNYLSATDVDSDDNTLTFTISNVQNCRFELITSPGTSIISFTQQQLANGNIQFVHTQVDDLPSFRVSASDGSLSTTPVDAMVFQIVNNQLVVEPSKTVPIILDNINVLTQQPATDTMIIITNVANGYFTQINNPGQSINSFSLQQITDGEIAFVKDNKDIAPTYEIRLSYTDATQLTPPITPDITLNHPPSVATKIQNQQASKGKPFDFTISENTFSDPDGDPLTVSLEMQDGSTKPAWLQFHPNYSTNRHRFFGRPATPGGVPIRVIARDPYNASANADFLLQVMGNITNVVNESTNPAPFIAAIAGGAALLAVAVAGGIGFFIKTKDRKTRQQHKFAQLIRHHLKLQNVDNFKSEDGQRFVQAVEGLSGLLQEEQGIDITTMNENRLDELASSIAISAKNKITPDTTGLLKKSKISITDFADNIEQIARDNRLDDISYAEVSDDVSIPMHTL